MLDAWNAFFFLTQIALVWAAFFRLPYTKRPNEGHHLAHQQQSLSPRKIYKDMFGNQIFMDRGGYLMKLWGYETISFCIILLLALIVVFSPLDDWQREALLFWVRTLYGLLSFPYIPFKVPLLANILLHTRRMGYDEDGKTVRVIKPKRD